MELSEHELDCYYNNIQWCLINKDWNYLTKIYQELRKYDNAHYLAELAKEWLDN
jgi:hypothetical protein